MLTVNFIIGVTLALCHGAMIVDGIHIIYSNQGIWTLATPNVLLLRCIHKLTNKQAVLATPWAILQVFVIVLTS